MNWNNSVHATVQDKGGIGKTLSASMLMQYALDRGFNIEGVDADPQAPKLSRITALNVPLLPLILHGEIQQSAFDPAFTHIIKSTTATLIDAGSGAFLPLLKYMSDNRTHPEISLESWTTDMPPSRSMRSIACVRRITLSH